MTKSIEVTGKTEDEALASALAKLGLDRDDVSVEILERAKSGFLGIGSSPAKIRVTYESAEENIVPESPKPVTKAEPKSTVKVDPKAAAAPQPKAEPAPKKQNEPAAEKSPVAAQTSAAQRAEEFLKGLLVNMGSSAVPVVEVSEDGSINVNLTGENLGSLIGRRGETLDAIQHLVNYSVNRGGGERVRINVDAENYRQKREDSLRRLAEKVAGKVVKYRKNITLEPMNSYERHVIHAALQNYKGVTTYSMDTEPNRRVVVAYDRSTAPRNSGHGGGSRGGSNNRGGRSSGRTNPETHSKPETPAHDSSVREWC